LVNPLVAVDVNVLMDLGADSEAVADALATIRQRLGSPRIIIPPTAKLELIYIAQQGDTGADRKRAVKAIAAARAAGIVPINLLPASHGIVERVAEALRAAGLIPVEEVNDSQLIVESALLEARLLLSNDEHLRGVDFERLTIELQKFDLTAPVIAKPSEVVRKFFLR
jgi:hypothetical protein